MRRARSLWIRVRCRAILALSGSVLGACTEVRIPSAPAREEVASAIFVRVLETPHPVLGIDDRLHLAYELEVVNHSPVLVTVVRVETLDASGTKLDDLAGDALAQRVEISGGERGPTFGASHSGFVLMDLALHKSAAAPALIKHRISVMRQARAEPGDDHHGKQLAIDYYFGTYATFTGAEVAVDPSPAISIGSPLRGSNWLAAQGCCDELTSHRGAVIPINGSLYVPERFAIDFVQLDRENRLFTGPVDRLSSYPYYGVPVYAVADGVIVSAQDGAADETPGRLPSGKTLATLPGNYIVLDIGSGHFAFYAHLKPASLRVKTGDRVRQGDVLGLLGNTGNTSNPHLHFHVMNGPSPLASSSLPYVISKLSSSGVVSSLDPLADGKPALIDPKSAGPHPGRFPLNNHVVTFE